MHWQTRARGRCGGAPEGPSTSPSREMQVLSPSTARAWKQLLVRQEWERSGEMHTQQPGWLWE